MHGETVMF